MQSGWMRRIILPFVACLVLSHFPTLFHKRYDFLTQKLLNVNYVLIFSTTFVLNISHSEKNSAKYYKYVDKSSSKVLDILVRF
jgi:hypothetical protein